MKNPPRIWLDYRPVRIGWVISEPTVAHLSTMAAWNACLWGGKFNCVIPSYDTELAKRLVSSFAVDILLPVEANAAYKTFIDGFPHLEHHRWGDSIFHRQDCEFADIRHPLRLADKNFGKKLYRPSWESTDPLSGVLSTLFGTYPASTADIANYGAAIFNAFDTPLLEIRVGEKIPDDWLEKISPLALTSFELTRSRSRRGWLEPGIVLGSASDFDALAMFWNLRAAGASVIFYDKDHHARLEDFANGFLARTRKASLDSAPRLNVWLRADSPRDETWKPNLNLDGFTISLCDGRGDTLWNGMNIEPNQPKFSLMHRDVVPSYAESDGKADASFALPGRPFNDDDVQSLRQKYTVVVDATQFGGPDAELTFETPFAPRLNEFYGRNFYFDHDSARSQVGRLDKGAVAIITPISTQRLSITAFRVFEWMKAFFSLCQITIERSEPGLRAIRLIAQLGGLQNCRVLKIRGVRNLLRKYAVDEAFTRSGAIDAIRDVDPTTGAVGFDAFEKLHIEFRRKPEMKPDDVLRYLLERRVFRVGLEFTCPNCNLPSWLHIDDVKAMSPCPYCDHNHDVTPQLKDRDWRYRRSGIFGRNDNQLGGVPVALTLQQLANSLQDKVLMYSTAINFLPAGAAIEACESDFVGVVAGAMGISESPLQIVLGEAKSEGPIDAQDIRKLGKLADAVPRELADAYILISKTGTFSSDEIDFAKSLNTEHRRRVILWSRDELEPYYPYERSRAKLGDQWHGVTLTDMARITHEIFFK